MGCGSHGTWLNVTIRRRMMYELAMLEWLVIAIVFTAGITGCVVSEGKDARAVVAAPAHAVSTNQSGEGS